MGERPLPLRHYAAAIARGAFIQRLTGSRTRQDVWNITYQLRGKIGGMQGAYYSDQCAPGKAMDEHLSDSTWATP